MLKNIADKDTLNCELQKLDTNVPSRTNGRKTEHVERYTMCCLLASIGHTKLLRFPLDVRHNDRPDFLISTPAKEIGVEVTEAIRSKYAEYSAKQERNGEEIVFDTDSDHFDGCVGDTLEKEWARLMTETITSKLEKLGQIDFTKYCQNWLTIYDGSQGLVALDLEKAISFFQIDFFENQPSFDIIFIQSRDKLLKIESSKLDIISLKNL
jgi:hypothetical protein